MTANLAKPTNRFTAEALERNELVSTPVCPFSLPEAGDLAFLLLQQMSAKGHKDIGLDPATGRLTGAQPRDASSRSRLVEILRSFSGSVTEWVKSTFPFYSHGLVRDRVTLRTEEEATRTLRLTSRNDLLHIDNFPTRPTHGRRILRVFTNINLTEPQVWATSEKFAELLARFAVEHRIPARSVDEWTAPSPRLLGLLGGGTRRSQYDALMSRLHHFLKQDTGFQATAARKVWTFPPGSTWALFTDGLANAQLRGSFALEHSFFVPFNCLTDPARSPLTMLSESTSQTKPRIAG